MKRTRFFKIATLGAILLAAVQVAHAEPAESALSISWRLLDNRPDNRFKAELTIRNDGRSALSKNWSIYFNSSAKLLPETVPKDFELKHVNGDFYFLRPAPSLKAISPGEHRTISVEGSPWALNVSDSPSGFYIVQFDERGQPGKPTSLPVRIEPFPDKANLHRGASDLIPVVTAESRFLENEPLTKLSLEQLVKVVPTPIEINQSPGHVTIDAATTIFYEPALRNEAAFLADAIAELIGTQLAAKESVPTAATSPNSIRLLIGDVNLGSRTATDAAEAYELSAHLENGITITGTDSAGVFYGIQTLRGLLPIEAYRRKNSEIPIDAVRIADAPRFPYRGLHLDVARNFQSKQTVKKLLDIISFYKLNRLHLHLTDDEGWRIEVKQLPELTLVGGRRGHTLDQADKLIPSQGSGPLSDPAMSPGSGYYSQEDFIEILRYARSRHIVVVPELDFPGHARAAIKSMEARQRRYHEQGNDVDSEELLLRDPGDVSKYESVQLWHDNVVDVGREDTYRFLKLVVGELSEMCKRAGVPLTSIHLGGDEVPKGAWEKSPACEQIATSSSAIPRTSQLQLYFLNRACKILDQYSIQPACWEDCLLLEVDHDANAVSHRRATRKPAPIAYVWNNVWGWGREDAAYRLANAGFDVVLCNATHLYFDLACEKDPLEPGYYWAEFVGMRAPFEFIPLDVFKNADRTNTGQPIDKQTLWKVTNLTPFGSRHIYGIQGQLWGENLRDAQSLEYMGFPRIIGLAERAWARSPHWAQISDRTTRDLELQQDWNQFANRLGQRELPRLDYMFGGVHYRLPPPGVMLRNGHVLANVALPGLDIRYTVDGTEPSASAPPFREPIPFSRKIKLRCFDTRGRGSRSSRVDGHNPPEEELKPKL